MNTSIRELMLAGAHFGHRTRFWNPKMADYIYGSYYQTHVINLDRTLEGLKKSSAFISGVAAENGSVLYVCAKAVAGEIMARRALEAGMPHVTHRWLGGMLTNFKTTLNSAARLAKMDAEVAGGALANLTKKEGIRMVAAKDKLAKSIGGMRDMKELPDALFIVDAGWHKGAVREANLLGIPVVAVVDTNHSPEGVDYVIPGNDDSRQAIEIYARLMSEAVARGREERDAGTAAALAAARENAEAQL